MYQVFLGEMPLPIAPSKIETLVGNRSETVELIDGREVNILKGQKLTEISFDFMIPSQNYPFATLAGNLAGNLLGGLMGSVTSTAIIEWLEKLKADKKPFQFICVRLGQGLSLSNVLNTNLTVTLEDYTIIEDASNGQDYMCNVRLKAWEPYSTKTYKSDGTVQKTRS